VADGRAVQAGDLLFVISGDRASALGSTQTVVAQTLETRQANLRSELQQRAAQTENQRIASLAQSLQQQDHELHLQRERTELIRDVAQRYPELVRSGAVSEVEAKEKATELIDQQARLVALYRQPRILVLDEATSHLDIGNEQHINDAVRAMALTRVIVAHRPETIAMAERVVTMGQRAFGGASHPGDGERAAGVVI
jgi:ABC-type transport system involved in Fe-S cluster assembly fused permease/ATPase subunit